MSTDVTLSVRWENPDDESLPLLRCVCGRVFGRWEMVISIYPEYAREMPCCGRRLYFRNEVRVFEAETNKKPLNVVEDVQRPQ
jgi:hypothetical protein